ncbi:MAG: VIT1/CCC1 transporter family protein [Synechococcales cyanobacterium C42_A2020_086]|jgi:VIT1/CCC1 family predicted Fe2+/Mn2+ transporter|nr:VIT1/CCC1 transporter family protein [Synechococcales cyanobacterium C42_A2020_086]
MADQRQIDRYLENWQDEVNSAYLYRALANAETQPALAEVYRRLAQTEEEHAQFWQEKLLQENYPIPRRKISWRTKVLATLAQWISPQFVLPTINAMEQVDSHTYSQQPDTHATLLPIQERSHARLLNTIASISSTGLEGNSIAQMEGRHRAASGNTLRAAVLGANDGLLSNLSLVMGVAGANSSNEAILITGFAGLLAGACSMALGEWLSVQSSRELYGRQIRIEKQELEQAPEEEEEELALIYEAKGLPPDQAQELAARIIQNQATALDTLAREELGVDPEELGGSAWMAGLTSFFLFATGAIIPVSPFLFLQGAIALWMSLLLSGLALFLIGAGITLLTGRSVLFSGSRQVLFGLAASGITFGIGRLLGVSLSG